MGFLIKYNRFFNVTFAEAGSEGALQGFRFFADDETKRKLLDFKLVFRPHSSGFQVYFSESPLIPITEKTRFTFGFSFSNSGIYEKYGLTKSGEEDTTVFEPGLYFDNLNSDGDVITSGIASIVAAGIGLNESVTAADTCHIYRQTFKVFNSAADTVPANYTLKHRFDSSLQQTIPVENTADVDTIITTINSVDLDDDFISQPGPYLLESAAPSNSRKIYLNDELGQKRARGVIDIYWDKAQNSVADAKTGQQYKITFKPN
ncbi:hypothetical protein BH23BAC3_BH23BAC3_07820 [soil metagenome]